MFRTCFCNSDKYNGKLHADIAQFFLQRKIFQAKVAEKTNTHILCYIKFLFFKKNCPIYEIMWKHILVPDRPQMTIWRMRIACWINKATNTHSQYVILIASHCNSGCKNASRCYFTVLCLPFMLFTPRIFPSVDRVLR